MKRHLAFLIPLLVLFTSTPLLQAQDPTFLIESLRVDGTSRTSSERIRSESYIAPGISVTEREIELAVRRIQRLSFVYDVTARLERGATQGSYVLVLEVVEVSPVFINAAVADDANSDFTTETAVAGYRWFVGDQDVIYGAVGHNTRHATVHGGWTRYGLFGGRGWAVLDVNSEVGETEFDSTGAELQINNPLGRNDGLRLRAAYRSYLYRSIDHPSGTERYSSEGGQLELGWYRDTTDDPLLPSMGTSIWVGLGASTGKDAFVRRLDGPDGEQVSGFRNSGEVYSASASIKGHRAVTRFISINGGASAAYREAGSGRNTATGDSALPRIRLDNGGNAALSLGLSGQLWTDQRRARFGDLRWEVGSDVTYWWQQIDSLPPTSGPERPWLWPTSGWGGIYSVGVAYRHRYGLLRLTFRGFENFR